MSETNERFPLDSFPSAVLRRLEGFASVAGHAYAVQMPTEFPDGDSNDDPDRSALELFENGVGLGPGHSLHGRIQEVGRGLFSHWHGTLYFAASDNSDPRSNGREYHVVARPSVEPSPKRGAMRVLSELPSHPDPAAAYHAIERCLGVLHPSALMGETDKLWWTDERLRALYRRLCGDNARSFERKFTVYNLLKALGHVDGDLAECGAYNGSTAYFMALAGEEIGRPRPMHLFDSFEGLSKPDANDGAFWYAGALALPEQVARDNLARFPDVSFYRGWIPERFAEVAHCRFAFVHIDVDLGAPSRDSIDFFYPRLQPGGILLCDDYGFTTCPGATKAMDDFFRDREKIIHLPTGQGFVIKQ